MRANVESGISAASKTRSASNGMQSVTDITIASMDQTSFSAVSFFLQTIVIQLSRPIPPVNVVSIHNLQLIPCSELLSNHIADTCFFLDETILMRPFFRFKEHGKLCVF